MKGETSIQKGDYLWQRVEPKPDDSDYIHLSDLLMTLELSRSDEAMTILDQMDSGLARIARTVAFHFVPYYKGPSSKLRATPWAVAELKIVLALTSNAPFRGLSIEKSPGDAR